MLGKLASDRGYENTLYLAELCTTVSLKGILSVKNYQRTWLVNECFAEAAVALFNVKQLFILFKQPNGVFLL